MGGAADDYGSEIELEWKNLKVNVRLHNSNRDRDGITKRHLIVALMKLIGCFLGRARDPRDLSPTKMKGRAGGNDATDSIHFIQRKNASEIALKWRR